jgi:sarcosine oxidase subunit beta
MAETTADVVVIGGGVRGAAIAYYLARDGLDVLLVERAFLASEASGANMGLINISRKRPEHYAVLSLRSAQLYPTLIDELGEDVGYEQTGNIDLVEREEELATAAAHVTTQNAVPGLHLRLLTGKQVREFEPALAPHIPGLVFCPEDGAVNPMLLTRALVRGARRYGARLWFQTAVSGIGVSAGKVTGVVTTHGEIASGTVVNAAGIHAPQIASMAGVDIAVRPQRGQLCTTERLAPLLRHPILDFRQVAAGNVLIGTTTEYVGEDRSVTADQIARMLRRAAALIPALASARVVRCWAGLRAMPEDGLPIYGEAPGVRGFYVATGHSGVTLAPVTGMLFRDLILNGRTELSVDHYVPARRVQDIKDEWASRRFKVR